LPSFIHFIGYLNAVNSRKKNNCITYLQATVQTAQSNPVSGAKDHAANLTMYASGRRTLHILTV